MINAFPFDSRITGYDESGLPLYDHASNAEEFARLLASFLRSGVFGDKMCEVLASDGMTATVGAGSALVDGRYVYLDDVELVQFEAAGTQNRIDTVVIRRDLSSAVNDAVVAVVKGTAAAVPAAPALTRDGTVWELGIANVLIPANTTAVTQGNITDTRLADERCGLVAAIMTDIDTTHFYDQIQADLEYFRQTEQTAFNRWFEDVQNVLDKNTAGSLYNMITGKASTAARAVNIPVTGWSGASPFRQEVAVEGVTNALACHVLLSWHPQYRSQYGDSGIRAVEQRNGSIVFEVDTPPASEFVVNVLIINPSSNADTPAGINSAESVFAPAIASVANNGTASDASAGYAISAVTEISPMTENGDAAPSYSGGLFANKRTVTLNVNGSSYSREIPEGVYAGSIDWVSGAVESTATVKKVTDYELEAIGVSTSGLKYVQLITGESDAAAMFACNKYRFSDANADKIIRKSTRKIFIYDNNFDVSSNEAALESIKDVEVLLKTSSPLYYGVQPQAIPLAAGENTVTSGAGNTVVRYAVDTKTYIDNKFAELSAALIGG